MEHKPGRSLRSAAAGLKNNHGVKAFSNYVSHNWNRLPLELRFFPTVAIFKTKTLFINTMNNLCVLNHKVQSKEDGLA